MGRMKLSPTLSPPSPLQEGAVPSAPSPPADETLPELPESPVALSAPHDVGNGFRLPRGNRWRPAGDNPEATAIVFIKEVWPPSLGPSGDDVFDFVDQEWRL